VRFLFRRSPSRRAERAGRAIIAAFAAGAGNPEPLAPDELDNLLNHAAMVASRNFGTDDEDDEDW
jgi:hypothetical protein